MHDILHISLLEQDITKKKRVEAAISQMQLDDGKDERGKYKFERIWDSAVYAKESESYLSGLQYLVL